MTAFTDPFGSLGAKRAPTDTEKEQGLPCGPLDRFLWTFLIHRLEANIKDVMDTGGVSALAEDDATALRRGIEAMIAAATGGGDTSQFVLFSQARARLPIFPDVQTADGKLTVTAPSTGTIRLAAGATFLHRGIFPVTTVQTDFPTDPSKTYHLRWDPTNGFRLLDLASGTYNPSTLAETDAGFDSTYDDMLVARVVTNSSNVATITTLVNRHNLFRFAREVVPVTANNGAPGAAGEKALTAVNWARTPGYQIASNVAGSNTTGFLDYDFNIYLNGLTRYGGTIGFVIDNVLTSATIGVHLFNAGAQS